MRTFGETSGDFQFGRVAGLQLSASPSALAGSALLWVLAAVLGKRFLRLSLAGAAAGGLAAVLLHWFAEMWHQFGHSRAAAMTGYPMTGVRLWGTFGASEYPSDEPELPAAIHVQRALGGPVATISLGLLALAFALKARRGSVLQALALLVFVENFLVFGLGAFVPLGFTDGSTLLRWAPQLREQGKETSARLPTEVY
jgi:hypothetical protein